MEQLKKRILEDGIVRSESILDVASFLNMQIDVALMKDIGETFAEVFEEDDFDVYLTVEASGIAPTVFAGIASDKPVVVIKKEHKLKENMLQVESYSYTKKEDYFLTVDKAYIEGKRCILIDDFLASGSVVRNIHTLCAKADATLVKTGIVVSKDFQEGMIHLEKEGYPVVSLARVQKMDPITGSIEFNGSDI
ncbi:MAG TPA: xanthine phosphoribosyltransferase [Erysipelothrix sp.]|nr:xanthine phosphoribosyltransferase [Erysipelothrix sp.]